MERKAIWTAPTFVEVRMDAEIGSYQDDFDPAREAPPFVRRERLARTTPALEPAHTTAA